MNFQQIRDFVNPAVGQATGIEPVDMLAMPVPTAHLMQAGGGGSITVDSELSETSTNPVENRVITAALKNLGTDIYFIIHVTWNTEGDNYIADKTYAEIRQAYYSGKIPVVIYREQISDDESETVIYSYWGASEDESVGMLGFYHITFDASGPTVIYEVINIKANNTITGTYYQSSVQEME